MLVYFGYTHCPDVCPTTLIKIAAALQTLGPSGRQVQPIFITVDPAHDTPEVVGDYATYFSPRILGLTGSPTQIAAVEKAYRVYSSLHATPAELDAAIDHSSVLYLMGPDGRFIAPIRTDGGPADVAADLSQYL
jgi:protein SCO1/2